MKRQVRNTCSSKDQCSSRSQGVYCISTKPCKHQVKVELLGGDKVAPLVVSIPKK